MKAMYLKESKHVVEEDVPEPDVRADQVLVNVERVHVCASDIEFYEKGRIGEFAVEEPIILGHESAGVVEEVGSEVDNLHPGDRVAMEPGVPCGRCEFCKEGRYNLCPNVEFMATPPHDGAFVEYIAHPADFTFKLPDSVSISEGAAVEPLSVGIHAVRRGNLQMGHSVAVLGAGPIGLMTVQAAKVQGADKIMVTDMIDARLEMAIDMGADRAVNLKEDSLEDHLGRYHRVFQAAGAAKAFQQATELVRRGGRIVNIGHPSTNTVEIDPNLPITREFDMVGSFRYCNTYPPAISLLEAGRVDVEPMISEPFPLADVEQALQLPHQNPEECVKASVSV